MDEHEAAAKAYEQRRLALADSERKAAHKLLHQLQDMDDERLGAVVVVTLRATSGANVTTIIADSVQEDEYARVGAALAHALHQASLSTVDALVHEVPGSTYEAQVDEAGNVGPAVPKTLGKKKGQVH